MKKEQEKKDVNKKLLVLSIMFIASAIIIISLAGLTSAYQLYCSGKGEKIKFCGLIGEKVICNSGDCQICMYSYDTTNKCYNYGGPLTKCYAHGANTCGIVGNGTSLDVTPPIITLTSPVNNSLYNKRNVLFSLSVNEKSDLYFADAINGRGRWSRLCANCMSYTGLRSFKDGSNIIRIKAVDKADNEAFKDVTFFVDSQKPRIYSMLPKSKFASGFFQLEYTETNLKKINLTYGNLAKGFKIVTLNSCASGAKVLCNTSVNLNDYNGQEISYWFSVEDNAGNSVTSKTVSKLKVDTKAPVINSLNYNITGKSVMFMVNITEDNLDVVQYMDLSASKPRFINLCTKLVNGMCNKKVTFSSGHHNLLVNVLDDAGNKAAKNASFDIS